jgi:hypothetical protein
MTLGEDLALCPNCKAEVSSENISREVIDYGRKARMTITTMVPMDVNTTMYSCPNCHIILGIAQYSSY